MKISAINNGPRFKSVEQKNENNKRNMHFHPLPTTGWTAAGAFGVSMISGMLHKPFLHKFAASIGIAATAAHVGIVMAHKYHHKEFKA